MNSKLCSKNQIHQNDGREMNHAPRLTTECIKYINRSH